MSESFLLSPAASLPMSHNTFDSETLYCWPSGISKFSGKALDTSTSNRGTEDEFWTSIWTSISWLSSEKTRDWLSSWSLSGFVSIISLITSIVGPLAE